MLTTPILLLLVFIIIVVIFISKRSSTNSLVTRSEDNEDIETETTSCMAKLNVLQKTLAAKRKELKKLRDSRKTECINQVEDTQKEIDKIEAKISHIEKDGGKRGPNFTFD